VGDVRVCNGDFVVADGTGVVFVSAGQVDAVLDAAEHIASREAVMSTALTGQPNYEERPKR
jgi:4-hydroxy-4-methyl-2-oxoglutarate aldolase